MKGFKSILPLMFAAAVLSADTITVTSLDDSGSGTLRDAITNAQSGDTIEFDSSLSGTITLQSALPQISVDTLTISGPIDQSISIDGNSSYRIFDVQVGPFTVSNLNLLNGADANQGGAVYVASPNYAYLVDLVITPATGADGDNALYADGDGVLDVTDTTFTSSNASQVYLNGGTINITSNSPLSFIIDGTGGAQVYKYGSSSAAIATPDSITSDYYLNVSDGLALFSGSLIDDAIVLSNGVLTGNFSIADIVNLGVVMAGDNANIGTMTLSADFYSVGGEVRAKVDSSGSSDLIEVEGSVYLNSSSFTLIPGNGTYTNGTVFTVLTTSGGVNGTFDTVSLGGLDAQVVYNENSIEIEILSDVTL